MSTFLPNAQFNLGQSMPNYFKAFTNYMSYIAKRYGGNDMLRYPSPNKDGVTFNTLSFEQVDRIATNLAYKLSKQTQGHDTVAFLGSSIPSDLIAMLALLKLRVVMLCISPASSQMSVESLLQKTNCKLVMTDKTLLHSAGEYLGANVVEFPQLNLEALSREPLDPKASKMINTNFSYNDITKTALIIHSSDLNDHPNPIELSNRYLFNLVKQQYCFKNVCQDLGCSTSLLCFPLFEMTGLWSAFSMLSFGSSITFMDPSPYKDIVSGMVHSKCAVIGATSTIIEQLVDDVKETKDASLLSSLKYIMYSGTPLCDGSERWIHSHDIHLHHMYGSAESGAVMGAEGHSLAPLFFDENGASYLNFEMTDEPNMRHLSIRSDCPSLANNVSNRLDGGYDTNDLFMVDHKNPGYYLYAGRKDDTFVMSNGEKTNPIPIENAIRASPIVHQVLVVGRNRQYTGCLVSVNTGLAHTMSPIELMDAVHIAVKEANIDCPKHSAILPQMVKILPLDKTIPITEKGTVIRKKAETEFKDMIDKLYEKLAHSLNAMDPQDGNIDPTTWSEKQVKTFLVENVSNILDKPISTFDDYNRSLFEFGLNSILAIQLRNQIAEHFDNVAQNFVFQHPTINDMYATLTSDDAQDALELIKARYLQTQEIALDYIKRAEKDFCVSKNNYDASKPKVILLTGATGSLGSFMLRDLLLDSTVKKVYCPVRGKQGQLFQRLIEAFESRFLDISLLKNTERVQAVPMRFNEPYLGFGKARYDQLREEVTIIQHCAWLVDFHMPVDHFDKECIAPFYNLLKFSSKEENPMHVHFISSVSAAALAGPEIEEAPLIFDSFVAMPIGYGQSKFIVERLLEYLNSEKNLPCYVERVGQVCGDSQNGVWNTTEQYPLMFIGGGAIMHKMPDFDLDIDWITVDYAAAAIVHIMHSTAHHPANKDGSVFHIVNPRRIHWSDILSAMRSAGMMFETVAPIEWLEALSKDASNPAFRLVPFYEDTSMATKMPIFKTEKTIAMAPIMEVSPVLDDGLFSKFLKHWKAIGFYQPLVTMQSKM